MSDDPMDLNLDIEDEFAAAVAEQQAAEQKKAAEALHQEAPVMQFKEFGDKTALQGEHQDLDFILDIPVQMTVELGRTKITIKNLLRLAQGSVVELDGLAGEPMDVLINGFLIAQGEVVVVNDKFGIRMTDIITPSERIKKLNK